MKIKIAELKDFESFLPIKEDFLKEYGISKKSKEFILEEFQDYLKKGVIFIAYEEDKIVSYLIGVIEENPYERSGYLEEVFTDNSFRGKGISSKLKDAFLEFLRNQKISVCRIDVNPDNSAQEVYKKWGFKIDKLRMSLHFN